MATKSRTIIYADLAKRVPATGLDGAAMIFPEIQAGQVWTIALRFIDIINSRYAEVTPRIRSVKAAVGFADIRPTGGDYSLRVGTATTAFIPHSADARRVERELNAMHFGTYRVDFDRGTYLVRRLDFTGQYTISVRENRLFPRSFVSINQRLGADGSFLQELRMVQSPIAFSDSAAEALPDPPFVRTVQDGYTSPDNSYFVNEIQELVIPADFTKGTYQLLFYDNGYGALPRRTTLLSLSDGAPQIEQALNTVLGGLPYPGRCKVENPSNNVARITFGQGGRNDGTQGANVPEMRVFVPVGGTPVPDWTFTLNFDTTEVWAALRDKESIQVPFELEIEVYKDSTDLSRGVEIVKIWSQPLTLKRASLFPALATAQNIEWLRPPEPRNYLPFDRNSISIGHRHYTATIPEGTDNINIAHNLDTPFIHVSLWAGAAFGTASTAQYASGYVLQLREAGTPGTTFQGSNADDRMGWPGYYIRQQNPNSVQIAFGTTEAGYGFPLGGVPDANGNNLVYGIRPIPIPKDVTVVITSAYQAGTFQQHTHGFDEVVGLEGLIDDLGRRMTQLEKLIPRPGVASVLDTAAVPSEFKVPSVGEVLPDLQALDYVSESSSTLSSQLVVSKNQTVTAPDGTNIKTQQDQAAVKEQTTKTDKDALPANTLFRSVLSGIGQPAKAGQAQIKDANGNILQEAVTEASANPSLWPARRSSKFPLLLGAIAKTSVPPQNVTTVPNTTGIYRNILNAALVIPGGSGRKSQNVPNGGLFAVNAHGVFYRVNESQTAYHPLEFDRELWRVFVGSAQFPPQSKLYVDGEIRMKLFGEFFDDDARDIEQVKLAAQFKLKCEALLMDADDLMGDVVETILLGETRVALSPGYETMPWQLRIQNSAEGISSTWTAYQNSFSSDLFRVPAVIRCRLCEFDVDNESEESNPRGQVALVMPQTTLSITIT
jgi:hypothetical protein